MCKANKNVEAEETTTYKTLEEMTDGEFLAEIDYCCEPLYLDYLYAERNVSCPINGYISDTHLGVLAKGAKVPVKETKQVFEETQTEEENSKTTKKNYVKKRVVAICIIAIVALAVLLISVLGVTGVGGNALAVFNKGDEGIAILDPIVSMTEYVLGGEEDGAFLCYFTMARNKYELIPAYATACAVMLFVVCMILILAKAVLALFEKRTVIGYYKKRKFGFLSIVAFLCAVIAAIGGLYASGGVITGIADMFVGKGKLCAGYGLYIMLAAPIVTLISSCFAYGKK